MVLVRGLLTGAKIALIVGVNAVGDRIETVRLTVAFEHGEQFVFAVETAHGIVALVGGIFQFLRFHHGDGNFVVAREGATPNEDELINLVKARKGSAHAPKHIKFVKELPMTGVGKVDKKVLKAGFWAGRERMVG